MPSKTRFIKAEERRKRMAAAREYLTAHWHDMTCEEMAKALGIHYRTVSVWGKKWGLGAKLYSKEQKEWRAKRIAEVYTDGDEDALKRLAEELGINRKCLRKTAERLGFRRSKEIMSRHGEALGKSGRGRRKYTPETIEWLREHYPTHSTEWCAEQMGISYPSVLYLVRVYGIRKNKNYTNRQLAAAEAYEISKKRVAEAYERRKEKEEAERDRKNPRKPGKPTDQQGFVPYNQWLHLYDDDIKAEYPERLTEDMAGEYGVNYYTMIRRASRLGVAKTDAFMRGRWIKGGGKKGVHAKKSTEPSDEYMKAHFANTSNAELANLFGVDVKTVRRWARRLGLQKSEAFMKEARGRRGGSYYTNEQKAWRVRRIAEVYPDGDEEALNQLSEELGISMGSIKGLATKNHIRRSKEKVSEAIIKGLQKHRKFTPELIAALREYYPDHTNEECAAHFGQNIGSLKRIANMYGLKKTKEHRSRINRESHHR